MRRPRLATFCRASLVLTASVLFLKPSLTLAETIPTEVLFKPDQYVDVQISPDGKYIAAIARVSEDGQSRNVLVMNLDNKKPMVLTGYKDEDVATLNWISDERLMFSVYDDFDSQVRNTDYVGTYAINRDGSKGTTLHTPFSDDRRSMRGASSSTGSTGGIVIPPRLIDPWFDNPDYVVVENFDSRVYFPEVSRLNVKTGKMFKLEINEMDIYDWMTDHAGQPRAGISTGKERDDLYHELLYKPMDGDEWITVTTGRNGEIDLLGFDSDNEHLFVSANTDVDTLSLYRVDPMNPQFEQPLVLDDTYDVAGEMYFTRKGKPLYVEYQADKPVKRFFDQAWADRQASIDAALPDTVNDFASWDDAENRFLIYSWSDRSPGDYYLYDETAGQLKYLMSTASWIDPEQMAPMMPIRFEARDGLMIHGYLTLPVNAGDGPYPIILHPHGGPYGIRDDWGFNREVQFLANRGYAVLQVNYRGSGGYGVRFEHDAYQKWGLEMQDDLTDAVEWTIEQGYADKDRVCIYGASYGGYATLMGLVKTPELYRCGIAYVGVFDLNMLYQDISEGFNVTGSDQLISWFAWAIGDPGEDKQRFYDTSPVNHVENIQAPIMVVHGVNDPIAPIAHSRDLVGRLKSEDKVYEYYEKSYEGHGFFTPANQIDLYNTIEAFLEKYNN